jgi:hypothetical protein
MFKIILVFLILLLPGCEAVGPPRVVTEEEKTKEPSKKDDHLWEVLDKQFLSMGSAIYTIKSKFEPTQCFLIASGDGKTITPIECPWEN